MPSSTPAATSPAPVPITLVTGPARSGKSTWAENLAQQSGLKVIYVATAQVRDDDPDWQARITAHIQRRPRHWQTRDVSQALPQAIATASQSECWLIDSLGTWLANCLEDSDQQWQERCQHLSQVLHNSSAQLIFVAEETGWGVVPAYATGRLFRDRLGTLIQGIGAIAQATYLVAGGYALPLHQLAIPLPTANAKDPSPT